MKKYSILLKIPAGNRKIIGWLALVLIFVVLVIYIFPAQLQNLDAVRRQVEYQANLIETREAKTSQLLSLKEQYSKLTDGVRNTHDMFFSRADVTVFLKGVNELAERETGNDLIIMQPLSEGTLHTSFIDNGGLVYKKKIIRLVIEGNFTSIENLIARFDNYQKLLRIENIKLEHEGNGNSKIRAQFDLSMYLLTDEHQGAVSQMTGEGTL